VPAIGSKQEAVPFPKTSSSRSPRPDVFKPYTGSPRDRRRLGLAGHRNQNYLWGHAAKSGSLTLFRWVQKKPLVPRKVNLLDIVASGSLDCLKWAIPSWYPETTSIAAKHGYFNILKWSIKHGCQWADLTMHEAAKIGNFQFSNGRSKITTSPEIP
jgi:hypothetical protein